MQRAGRFALRLVRNKVIDNFTMQQKHLGFVLAQMNRSARQWTTTLVSGTRQLENLEALLTSRTVEVEVPLRLVQESVVAYAQQTSGQHEP